MWFCLCVMWWVLVRYSEVLKNYHILSCDVCRAGTCRSRAVRALKHSCAQRVCDRMHCEKAALRIRWQCRRDTASARRHSRIKQHQQVTIVWWGNSGGKFWSKGGKYGCLASLTDHVVFPALGQWGVMNMHQISSLVHVFVCDNTTSEKHPAQHISSSHPAVRGYINCLCSVLGFFLLSWSLWWPVALSSTSCSVGLAGSPPGVSCVKA